MRTLIERWRDDPGSTYRTWFLWEERLKNFRSIRRGLSQVVDEIKKGSFGNVYKGSSLETVVGSIAEQRQIFKGANHAFSLKAKTSHHRYLSARQLLLGRRATSPRAGFARDTDDTRRSSPSPRCKPSGPHQDPALPPRREGCVPRPTAS